VTVHATVLAAARRDGRRNVADVVDGTSLEGLKCIAKKRICISSHEAE